jgi:hypothetical protein
MKSKKEILQRIKEIDAYCDLHCMVVCELGCSFQISQLRWVLDEEAKPS